MAAVLCTGLGKICSTSCSLLSSLLTLPCKACGLACEGLSAALRSPFCIYLSVTLGLNLPPIVFAVQTFLLNNDGGGGCEVVWQWLLVNAVLCAVNVIAAVYISWKIAYDKSGEENDEDDAEEVTTVGNDTTTAAKATPVATAIPVADVEAGDDIKASEVKVTPVPVSSTAEPTPSNNNNNNNIKKKWPLQFQSTNRAKSLSRVRDVLCHDPIVALYILIGIGYIVWQALGVTRMNLAQDDYEECGELGEVVSEAVMFGFLFISLGAVSFCCSVCCLR